MDTRITVTMFCHCISVTESVNVNTGCDIFRDVSNYHVFDKITHEVIIIYAVCLLIRQHVSLKCRLSAF